MTRPTFRPCLGCGHLFRAKKVGGNEQKWCTPACKTEIESLARKWVVQAIEAGLFPGSFFRAWGTQQGSEASRAAGKGDGEEKAA